MSFADVKIYNPSVMVKVVGRSLPISRKKAYEVAKYIKYLPVKKAKMYLEEVIQMKRAIPYTRYNKDIPHKRNIDGKVKSGRYPVKVAKYFLKLLDSLEKNAQFRGFDTSKLIIIDIQVYKGPTVVGRMRNLIVRKKRTHVLILAAPIETYDPGKKYRRKELKALVKEFLGK